MEGVYLPICNNSSQSNRGQCAPDAVQAPAPAGARRAAGGPSGCAIRIGSSHRSRSRRRDAGRAASAPPARPAQGKKAGGTGGSWRRARGGTPPHHATPNSAPGRARNAPESIRGCSGGWVGSDAPSCPVQRGLTALAVECAATPGSVPAVEAKAGLSRPGGRGPYGGGAVGGSGLVLFRLFRSPVQISRRKPENR